MILTTLPVVCFCQKHFLTTLPVVCFRQKLPAVTKTLFNPKTQHNANQNTQNLETF